MNCSEARNLAPLYLSGELDGDDYRQFATHLDTCVACRSEMEAQAALDARIATAIGQHAPDTSVVHRRFREQAYSKSRLRWVAAAALTAAGMVYGIWQLAAPPRLYADAARNHHIELVEKQARPWKTGAAEVEGLAIRYGLSIDQVEALAAPGYILERAKICGLTTGRMLHLVYTNGQRSYSLFLRPNTENREQSRSRGLDAERVAEFKTGRFQGVVVTNGTTEDCNEFIRAATARL